MEESEPKGSDSNGQNNSNLAKFTGIAFQMIAIIGIFAFAGYKIDKAYAKELIKKSDIYRAATKTEKQIFISIITSSRLQENMYSEELITSTMSLNDLFEENFY